MAIKRRRRKKKIPKIDYIQLEARETTEFREMIHESQDMICPICKELIEHKDTTLDHQHKLNKSQPIGKDGAGLIRGVICRVCNTYEGKIWNNYVRLGFHKKDITRAVFLRSLADYYDSGHYNYIHPTEKPKIATMGVLIFNRINKAYMKAYPNRKPLDIPASAIIKKGVNKGKIGKWKITKRWQDLINQFDIKV